MMKINLLLNEKNVVVGFQTSPLIEDETLFDVEVESIYLGYSYVKNGVFYSNKQQAIKEIDEKMKEEKLDFLRLKRKPLLEAFDKWEKAVLRGREEDSVSVMNWYKAILDLNEIDMDFYPDVIAYYLGGEH